MAGLVPAIPAFETAAGGRGQGVDARRKAGHDERGGRGYAGSGVWCCGGNSAPKHRL